MRKYRPDIEVEDIATIAGVGLDQLCRDGLDAARYAELLSHFDGQRGEDCFSVTVGLAADIAEFGIFGYTMLSSQDAEAMARVGVNYQLLNGYGFTVRVRRRNGNTALIIERNPALAAELNLSLMLEFIGATVSILEKMSAANQGRPILMISLASPRPTFSHSLETQLLLPVLYDEAENALVFNPQVIASFSSSLSEDVNALFLQRCEEQLARISTEHEQAIVNQVKRLIYQLLQNQVPTQLVVAEQLCVSPRTMNRRLKVYDTSFSQLLLDCRMTLAKSMLIEHKLPIDEIAYRLGYHQPNSFFRAFRKHFGTTPRRLASDRD